MGKGWRNFKGKGGGGGGTGGFHNDLKSVQGHACILGTSDSTRVKEANKDMLNLVNEAVEELYPRLDEAVDGNEVVVGNASTSSNEHTVSDLLKEELEMLKKARKSSKQIFTSVNTKVKGVFCIKFLRKEICPVRVVCSIFDRVSSSKEPVSRYICRLIPVMKSFYPDLEEVVENVRILVHRNYGVPGEDLPLLGKRLAPRNEGQHDHNDNINLITANKSSKTGCTTDNNISSNGESPSRGGDFVVEHKKSSEDGNRVVKDEFDENVKKTETVKVKRDPSEFLPARLPESVTVPKYCVLFKRRNASTLVREECTESINNIMPIGATVDYKQPQVTDTLES